MVKYIKSVEDAALERVISLLAVKAEIEVAVLASPKVLVSLQSCK